MWYDAIVVPPPSVYAVPARGREARKRNLSIRSNPVSLFCVNIIISIISLVNHTACILCELEWLLAAPSGTRLIMELA